VLAIISTPISVAMANIRLRIQVLSLVDPLERGTQQVRGQTPSAYPIVLQRSIMVND
jgi:hypothetical protein